MHYCHGWNKLDITVLFSKEKIIIVNLKEKTLESNNKACVHSVTVTLTACFSQQDKANMKQVFFTSTF